jgi:L-alanine-DL-glutamate epimerase-like enolase superfamily enzyme
MLALLSPDLRALCAADEDLLTVEDAVQMAHHPQPYGIYNIKLMKCGGVDHGVKIAEVAEMAGIHLMWGCNDESVVSISAALHAALASPNTRYIDLDGSFDLARDIAQGGFVLRDGCLVRQWETGFGSGAFSCKPLATSCKPDSCSAVARLQRHSLRLAANSLQP